MSVFTFGSDPGSVVGVDAIPPFAQATQIMFGGTWADGDLWEVILSTTAGDITLGAGNFATFDVDGNLTGSAIPTTAFTYRNRVYIGCGNQFNFCDNDEPLEWEQQSPTGGAGFIDYLSYFGSQDTIRALQQLQGRLAVFAARSIQIWTVDADPNNFAIVQEMDNIGTEAPESVKNLGDFDAIFLDVTGFRSLRQREVTQNAYVDDVGVAIDTLVVEDLAAVSASTCQAVVDPATKRYWAYLNGKIYVSSRYLSTKITAWSTYDPVDHLGNAFVPERFVILDGVIWCRTTDGRMISYGGTDGTSYDGSVVTVELPWLDDKAPKNLKYFKGMDVAVAGQWKVRVSVDPRTYSTQGNPLQDVYEVAGATGDESFDSSFDLRNISFQQRGTHLKIVLTTNPAWTDIATLSEVQYHYDRTK